ncbi:ATP-binding protein [Halobacteria archaeon AArc-dxtr1]|nr:ATP-binding protein [Halobacteria archaeon AArc-dxtr1]
MSWTFSPISMLIFGGALVAMLVAVEALRHRPDPMAWPLAVSMLAAVLWAIPHGIGIGYSTVDHVVFWQQVQYLGIVLLPTAYFVLALTFAGYNHWLTRRIYAALAIVPLTTLAIVWTNPAHGLFWTAHEVTTVGDAAVFTPEFGPWFWVHLGYSYLLITLSLAVLATVVVRSGMLYRKQATLIFFGGLVPLTVNAGINLNLVPFLTVDLTTTAFAISGLAFALALFHFEMLEIRPVARNLLVDELDDGVVVVGPDGQIRDYNQTATAVLGGLELNQPAADVFPDVVAPDNDQLSAKIDGDQRQFRTRTTPLTDDRNRTVGRIVYLNDITETVEREQRISVLNRILRHNIRNEMNVAAGHLDLLDDQPARADEHVARARERIDRVVEFADKARRVERTINSTAEVDTVSPVVVVTTVVADARERFPNAVIEFPGESGADSLPDVRVADIELFEQALAELVENAVVHNDREPRVTLSLEATDDRVHIHVADNGPGVPHAERTATATRVETQLDHGSGLGLWLVRWTASLSSASLTFAENEPRGSIVTLSLPAASASS